MIRTKKLRQCPKCDRALPLHKFHVDTKRFDGLQLWCMECNNTNRRRRYHEDESRRAAVRLASRKSQLKCIYGMSLDDYDILLGQQGGVCAICENPETQRSNKNGAIDSLRVDHDHDTGKVRGLLCSKCNFGIGQFQDNIDLLKRAIVYLRKNNK